MRPPNPRCAAYSGRLYGQSAPLLTGLRSPRYPLPISRRRCYSTAPRAPLQLTYLRSGSPAWLRLAVGIAGATHREPAPPQGLPRRLGAPAQTRLLRGFPAHAAGACPPHLCVSLPAVGLMVLRLGFIFVSLHYRLGSRCRQTAAITMMLTASSLRVVEGEGVTKDDADETAADQKGQPQPACLCMATASQTMMQAGALVGSNAMAAMMCGVRLHTLP